jgi:D-amino-acid dehydrogenase
MTDLAGKHVLVAGGGIIGIACAHYLSQAGCQVTVIDQGELGGACSHGNCGYICPSHVPPLTEPGAFKVALKSLFNPRSPFRVKPSLNPALLTWMWQFARRCNARQMLSAGNHLNAILQSSHAEYRSLMALHNLACEWKEIGLLYVFRQARAMDDFGHLDQWLTEHFGITAVRISGKDLPGFDPALKDHLHGAFHYAGDASVRPDLLNAAWVRLLKVRGVRFLENCALLELRSEAGRAVGVRTSRGDFAADEFVFALGALSAKWSKPLRVKLPVQPGKGYSVTMPRPENCPKYPMLFPERKVGVSPFDNGLRLGSMMEFAGYDESIPAYRIQQLRDAARDYLHTSVDGPAQETWYGWRPMTWDSLPIIGPIPGIPNAYLATGHNMLGVTLAPATGRLIAEMIGKQPPHIDPAPYSPTRF